MRGIQRSEHLSGGLRIESWQRFFAGYVARLDHSLNPRLTAGTGELVRLTHTVILSNWFTDCTTRLWLRSWQRSDHWAPWCRCGNTGAHNSTSAYMKHTSIRALLSA